MIALLTGKVRRKAADYLIIDVGGVGYQVQVPLSTLTAIPDAHDEIMLHIHTHVREDAIALYGFRTASEKDLFLLLTNITGIGPKLALAVLSSLPADDLVQAIRSSDDALLCAVPGIGRKTAARIVLELKDKIKVAEHGGSGVLAGMAGIAADAVSALVNLGYKRQAAEDAVGAAGKARPGLGVEALIKEALTIMMKR